MIYKQSYSWPYQEDGKTVSTSKRLRNAVGKHDWDSQICLHIRDLSLKGSSMSYTLSPNLTFTPIETTQITVASHTFFQQDRNVLLISFIFFFKCKISGRGKHSILHKTAKNRKTKWFFPFNQAFRFWCIFHLKSVELSKAVMHNVKKLGHRLYGFSAVIPKERFLKCIVRALPLSWPFFYVCWTTISHA